MKLSEFLENHVYDTEHIRLWERRDLMDHRILGHFNLAHDKIGEDLLCRDFVCIMSDGMAPNALNIVISRDNEIQFDAPYPLNEVAAPENLNTLSERIFQANKAKGFWDGQRNVGELLMLVTSELGEAMEAHRKGRFASIDGIDIDSETFIRDFQGYVKDTFEDEIADAIIRLLDMAGGLGMPIQWHIDAKLKYNRSRPRLHGKLY